jgi:hypothetical protein
LDLIPSKKPVHFCPKTFAIFAATNVEDGGIQSHTNVQGNAQIGVGKPCLNGIKLEEGKEEHSDGSVGEITANVDADNDGKGFHQMGMDGFRS